MADQFALRAVSFRDLPGWERDDPRELLPALQRCRAHIRTEKPYKTGALGVSSEDLLSLMDAAEGFEPGDAQAARVFFEDHCRAFKIEKTDDSRGFVTAFYEPEVDVRATPDDNWSYPFYQRPDDLIDLNDDNRPASMEKSYVFGLQRDGVISEYPDREAIDKGYLEGRGLEIAWARSKEDVFFAHVQGAARLLFPDGQIKRITYVAKAGHPFSGIGKKLIDLGEIALADISMGTIRQWLRSHPDRSDEIYWHNRSYIFFREVDPGDLNLGPVAAAKVQMAPGRSLAVDRKIHTFGCPFFISSDTLTQLDDGQPFQRLMLALDTGSAIVGPARGDIFTGSGVEAGDLAGAVRNEADFFILIPKAAAARYRDQVWQTA